VAFVLEIHAYILHDEAVHGTLRKMLNCINSIGYSRDSPQRRPPTHFNVLSQKNQHSVAGTVSRQTVIIEFHTEPMQRFHVERKGSILSQFQKKVLQRNRLGSGFHIWSFTQNADSR